MRHAQTGFKATENNVRHERLSICNNCPAQKNGFCKQCGCVILAKTYISSEKCPLEKW